MGLYLDCFSYYEGMALRYDNDTYSHLASSRSNRLSGSGFSETFLFLPLLSLLKGREEEGSKNSCERAFFPFCWSGYRQSAEASMYVIRLSVWRDCGGVVKRLFLWWLLTSLCQNFIKKVTFILLCLVLWKIISNFAPSSNKEQKRENHEKKGITGLPVRSAVGGGTEERGRHLVEDAE